MKYIFTIFHSEILDSSIKSCLLTILNLFISLLIIFFFFFFHLFLFTILFLLLNNLLLFVLFGCLGIIDEECWIIFEKFSACFKNTFSFLLLQLFFLFLSFFLFSNSSLFLPLHENL